MSQLRVSSFTGNYFKIPRTTYEKYVNKKWDERMNQFETKQTFIKRTLSEEKNSTHEHREQFLITPARENLKRRSIKFHLSTVNRTSSKETKKVEKPPFLELLFIQKMLLPLFIIGLHFLMIKKSCLSRKQ